MTILRCFDPIDSALPWDKRQSKPPDSLDAMLSANQLVLGHVTSSTFLNSIRQQGLVPDLHKQRTVDDGVPSDATSVYLRATWDSLYAERAVTQHGGSPIVVVVCVSRTALEPDEAVFAPTDAKTLPLNVRLYHSLCSGACKHQGAIPSDDILGIYDESAAELF
jgi:hypothetical protein